MVYFCCGHYDPICYIHCVLHIWGGVYNEYSRSEEENNILIDRLGDKYVQLEQAKEIQNQYDKIIESNNRLEEANKNLPHALQFYTLQQISQAITRYSI